MLTTCKGHCRRRKIRCIPSPSDSQGRCINCIRLKKECSFHPVDQQVPIDARVKPSSLSSTGSKVGSATSSPASSHANSVDQTENPLFSLSTAHPVPGMSSSVTKTSGAESFVPEGKGKTKRASLIYGAPVLIGFLRIGQAIGQPAV